MFPPGVDQPLTSMIGAPQQSAQLQGTRPPSAAAQQLLPQQQLRQNAPNAFPGSLSDLVTSFENVKQKGISFSSRLRLLESPIGVTAPHRMSDLGHLHKLLEGSYTSMPQPQDTEKYVTYKSSKRQLC